MLNANTIEHLPTSDNQRSLQLRIYRLLFRLGAHKQFITQQGFGHPALVEFFHLSHLQDQEFTAQLQQSVLRELRQRHAELEQQPALLPLSDFEHAVATLARRIGLNAAESAILAFTLQLHQELLLDETAEWLGMMTLTKVYRVLSTLLDLSENEVRMALDPGSLLMQTGLIRLESSGSHSLRNKLEPFSLTLSERLYAGETEPAMLLQGIITRCTPAHLNFSDYAHLPAVNVVRQWLNYALQSRRVGVNILIHGRPGTGKSQLCRLLAEELQTEIYEVASENEAERPINGSRRLNACRAAQRFFHGEKTLLLLDEAEDVFTESSGALSALSLPVPKAWINRLLEENMLPTLWVSNDISSMDPAFIRRFDIVLELTPPPLPQREALLRDSCGAILTPGEISQLASSPWLTPAVVQRAGTVVTTLSHQLADEKPNESLVFLINNTLKAQGHAPIRPTSNARTPALYDIAFVNSDISLGTVTANLAPEDAVRFCLYGPPGTGKTAWAQWLAKQLGLPLMARKPSDFFGRYVGESEQNIAATFEQARRDKAVLLLDEIDSFLATREEGQHRWEISCVNEMLSQIESFDGIMVTTTNRFEVLDAAAIRRFDLKVRFNFLCDYQSVALLNLYCDRLQLGEPSAAAMNALTKLSSLTPGDFFVVSRQHRVTPFHTASDFVTALKTECWLKKREKPAIGFLH
ncbi:AAA family ATPase [Pantoea sp. At-9b]|uniref:AAA family ATPase n=1 Tax=Pantoea sp. (strain At-9b) TaxID=592316 RepID=UPI0001B406FE|nr:ATP-binding protein [Pantoea sp. At-9b]ADU72440.1 AAA ATPase central domain protein [Pantoea sp. At-9b]